MSIKNTIPAQPDLGIKMGTKVEQLWTNVKREAEGLIEQSENNLIIQKEMLLLAKVMIRKEQEKGKV